MIVDYPGWYEYFEEFFVDLDHKSHLSLQVNSFFLTRRVLFVAVALYLSGYPAL